MMASRFLKPAAEAKHGRLYNFSERMFEGLLKGYERGLDVVLEPPASSRCSCSSRRWR